MNLYLVMIILNQHVNDAVMIINCVLNPILNRQYNCQYPFVYYCDDHDDHDDDGDDDDVNDFGCHSFDDDDFDFVDLTTITMDHNVAFRYLNHFLGHMFRLSRYDRYCENEIQLKNFEPKILFEEVY